jgi:hypothetical protein
MKSMPQNWNYHPKNSGNKLSKIMLNIKFNKRRCFNFSKAALKQIVVIKLLQVFQVWSANERLKPIRCYSDISSSAKLSVQNFWCKSTGANLSVQIFRCKTFGAKLLVQIFWCKSFGANLSVQIFRLQIFPFKNLPLVCSRRGSDSVSLS